MAVAKKKTPTKTKTVAQLKKEAAEKRRVAKSKADLLKFDKVMNSIEWGSSLRKSLDINDLKKDMFYSLCDSDESLAERYMRACEERQEFLFDELLDIADESTLDNKKIKSRSGADIEVLDKEYVMRSALRIETRKWALSKMNPKKYGDRIEVDGKTTHVIEME
tara:strand:+ start:257 stop:748 length:492 start_codon:yes stop_codon:yes gene_type:complete